MKEDDKIRYSRISDILVLLIEMQSNPLGITLTDIQEILKVSRRTAERLRDAIITTKTLNAIPQGPDEYIKVNPVTPNNDNISSTIYNKQIIHLFNILTK